MEIALRPYITSGIALVGAAVLVAAPISVPAPELAPAPISVAVESASVVTDLLDDFEVLANATGQAIQVLLNATGTLPLLLAGAAQAAIDDPELIPSLASFVAYALLSPGAPIPGVLAQFEPIVAELAGLLPPPLGPDFPDSGLVLSVFGVLSSVIANALAVLPNPLPGAAAVPAGIANLPAFVVGLGEDFQKFFSALGTSVAGGSGFPGIAGWIGAAPAYLLGAVQAAVANPSDIPGLLSGLVYSVVSPPSALFPLPPNVSLVTAATAPVVMALSEILPFPFGSKPPDQGLVLAAFEALGFLVSSALSLLPAPIIAPVSSLLSTPESAGAQPLSVIGDDTIQPSGAQEDPATSESAAGEEQRENLAVGSSPAADDAQIGRLPDDAAHDQPQLLSDRETAEAAATSVAEHEQQLSDPGALPDPERPVVNLNVVKDNPLAPARPDVGVPGNAGESTQPDTVDIGSSRATREDSADFGDRLSERQPKTASTPSGGETDRKAPSETA